jgi:hypothetical protein
MSELLTDQETEPQRRDWLADRAVHSKPVSAEKTGKNTGKFGFPDGNGSSSLADADVSGILARSLPNR